MAEDKKSEQGPVASIPLKRSKTGNNDDIHVIVNYVENKEDGDKAKVVAAPKDKKTKPTQDIFNRCLSWFFFICRFCFFLGVGIWVLYFASNKTCTGTPGLLTFIQGIGVLLIFQAAIVVLDFWYFQYHQADMAAQFFKYMHSATQICALALSIYGIVQFALQVGNEYKKHTLEDNGVPCDDTCAAKYDCDTGLFEASIAAAIISLLVAVSLLYRIVNFYRLSSSSGSGGGAVFQ